MTLCQSIERVMEGGSEEEKDLPFHLAFGLFVLLDDLL